MVADRQPEPSGAGAAAGDTAPERIDRALTRAILRGTYAPGSHLPTVRELAGTFGVNPSTIQRALARLESRGLVTARQGSGLTVNDPWAVGDLSLIPDWLEALGDDPERSAALLADILELRRMIVGRHLATHREAVLGVIDDIVAGTTTPPAGSSIESAWRFDSGVAHAVLEGTGSLVLVAIQNTMDRALAQLPDLLGALYEDPDRVARMMVAVTEVLRAPGPDLAERIEAVIADSDAIGVEAYRRVLAARPEVNPD